MEPNDKIQVGWTTVLENVSYLIFVGLSTKISSEVASNLPYFGDMLLGVAGICIAYWGAQRVFVSHSWWNGLRSTGYRPTDTADRILHFQDVLGKTLIAIGAGITTGTIASYIKNPIDLPIK